MKKRGWSSSNRKSYFDEWTLSKGKEYFKNGNVRLFWTVEPGEVHGDVAGSGGRIYRSKLILDERHTEVFETECSCPVGEDCKHTVALYLAQLRSIWNPDAPKGSMFESPKAGSEPSPSDADSSAELQVHSTAQSGAPRLIPYISPEVRRSFESLASVLSTRYESTEVVSPPPKNSKKMDLLYLLKEFSWQSDISLEMYSVPKLKDGSYGKPTQIHKERILSNPPAYATVEDKDIAKMWDRISSNWSSWRSSEGFSEAEPELLYALMKRVLATGRCYFEDPNGSPLKLGPELPGVLNWREFEGEKFRLIVEGCDGDNRYPCMRSTNHQWYVDLDSSVCGPVKIQFDARILKSMMSLRSLRREEIEYLPELFYDLGLSKVLPPPPTSGKLEIRLVKPISTLEVKELTATRDLIDVKRDVVIKRGDSVRVAVVSSVMPAFKQNGWLDETGKMIIERPDQDAIKSIGAPFAELGFSQAQPFAFNGKQGERFLLSTNPEAWIGLDEAKISQMRENGWQISAETEEALQPIEPDADDFDLEINAENNWWFSLALNISFNGKAVPLLPILISAIRGLRSSESIGDSIDSLNKNGKFVGCLPDGTLIRLPFDRIRSILQSLKELIEKGLDPDKKLPVVDAADLFEDETLSRARFIGADKILRLVNGLKALAKIEAIDGPKKFGTELRQYQKEGLGWLQFMAQYEFGGILADDMGLGKTIQLLAHICMEKEKKKLTAPYLVLCPTSVLPNWISETAKFAPQLKVVSYHGHARFANLREFKNADIVLSTYPILTRDIDVFKENEWHGIALDEAQAIKNSSTKLAQAARSLKAKHKFCLTGTPVENHLGELWSQFQFLLPGLLGDSAAFKNVFRDPIEKMGDFKQKKILAQRIKPFIIRRTKQEVAQELPDKTIIVQKIQLDGSQRDLYETVRLATYKKVRDEIAQKGFKQSQIMILDALLKMRQVCCDPRLVKLTAASKVNVSAKLDRLIEMLTELTEEGRKILLFSQFTSMLELIEARLVEENLAYVKLTGSTKDRAKPVSEFQNGTTPIFLISLKAGGTGLNLTAADVVIHYDPWWNPSVEEQATDRAHRIGQTKKVFVYKLIAEGTIEERMQALQEKKRGIAASIYDEQGNLSMKFSEDDLESLLQPIEG